MPQRKLDVTKVAVELDPDDAGTLALFIKRMSWLDYKSCAENDDQAYEMKYALQRFQKQINNAGFDPR